MTTADDVLRIARSHLGYAETPTNDTIFGRWYGMNYNPWCAQFVSYCSLQAGLPVPATTARGYAYCPSGVAYFKRLGRWSQDPHPGDHIFFSFPGEGAGANHVGLVEKVLGNGVVQTIEGNTDNRVMRRNRRGYIVGYGHPPYGSAEASRAAAPHLNAPVCEVIATVSGNGYWEVAEDGGVFAFGDAPFFGSMGGHPMNAPVVGAAAHPRGHGYWLVGADGGVFNFGAAKFFGSMAGQTLNEPIKGIAVHPSGDGYWLVGADGGVFAFGAAGFRGSTYDFKKT